MEFVLLTGLSDAHIKSISQAYLAQYEVTQEEPEATPAVEAEPADAAAASATETEQVEAAPAEAVNGDAAAAADTNGAAPAAEEAAAAPESAADLSTSQEWVSVPRPAEPESSTEPSPVAPTNGQSWADDHPETPADVS